MIPSINECLKILNSSQQLPIIYYPHDHDVMFTDYQHCLRNNWCSVL